MSGVSGQSFYGMPAMQAAIRNSPDASPAMKAYKNFYDSYGTGTDRIMATGGQDIMPYGDFRRLYNAFGLNTPPGGGGNDGGGGTTPPVIPPNLEGLMQQAADPYGTYGQLGVANPYLSAINNRFNYDPSGLAYGVNLQQSPSWYLPPMVYPNTVLPKISGASTGSGSTRG